MDKIKGFFEKKKRDKKFKKAGEGHRLAGPSGSGAASRPSTHPATHATNVPITQERINAADVAAHAALKRLHLDKQQPQSRSQQAIKLQVKRDLEREKLEEERGMASSQVRVTPERTEVDQAPVLDVQGVFFTCELLGDDVILPKHEMTEAVRQFLLEQLGDDGLVASVLMLHSLNGTERRRVAVETLCKYVDNLLLNPHEPKFRRVRLSNKAFQERVEAAAGGAEFLKAIGFEEMTEEMEQFLIISEEQAMQQEQIQQAKDVLVSGVPVPLKLYRNPSVLKMCEGKSLANPKLPEDFFDLSSLEVKKEQQTRTEQIDKMLTLRTKEMRERDEILRSCRYKYTLIRVRFPNGYIYQGTFSCYEQLKEVRSFVQGALKEDWAPFVLRDSVGTELREEERSLADLGLAPAAIVRFDWDPDVVLQWSQSDIPVSYLADPLLQTAQFL